MRMVQYAVWKKETNNAGGKAKNDAFDIALEMGFEPSYRPSKYRPIRVLQQIISMRRIRRADILFVQYPAVESRLLRLLFRNMRTDCVSIALIHDLRSIQGIKSVDDELEIEQLKNFGYLIVHNNRMENYLRERGYTGRIVRLDLFDYLHDESVSVFDEEFRNSVSVAGNLTKAQYTLKLEQVNRCYFDLFGIKGDMDFSSMSNVEYKGMLPSDTIVHKLTGNYGLIWDGDSLDGCTGIYGEYLKYNNPHKLSLCMAAGKPVIVWTQAAVAEFVQKEKVGLCVNSLEELNQIDLQKNYAEFKENARRIKHLVANGAYLKEALKKILHDAEAKDIHL